MSRDLPVLIIGAGPVGMAAAAHLHREGRRFLVLEAGRSAGTSVAGWGHVRLFTAWRHLIDEAARTLLEQRGWVAPDPDLVPTGKELLEAYVSPLARVPDLAEYISYEQRVIAVARHGLGKMKSKGRADAPFEVHARGPDGAQRRYLADFVIDASGTYETPNWAGAGGLPAAGEREHADRITYGIPDAPGTARERFASKQVGVIGSGHSAFNALLALDELWAEGTRTTWFVRAPGLSGLWGGGAADELGERALLAHRTRKLAESGRIRVITGFATDSITKVSDRIASISGGTSRLAITSVDGRSSGPLDEIVVATGYRPDLSITRELRLELHPVVESPVRLGPLIDPNIHSCGTVPPHGYQELAHPEDGFFTVGMKSYGRAPTFLLLTGYEQVRSVVKAIVGDLDAARSVELCLPGTGVCNAVSGAGDHTGIVRLGFG